ncbi:hypothetical protein V2J09_023011 [Rumex salicifolius]
MVGTNLKAETMTLMDKRASVEAEMNSIIDRLCNQPAAPGLEGNLVDSEGFPRSDIDIQSVRADRRRLSVLKNDHKNLTESINHNIELLHSSKVVRKPSNLPAAEQVGLGHATGDVDMITDIPFAMVDEIAEASPVAEDGLHLGDQILKFGTIESGDNLLSQLASEVQENQGCAIPVVLLRQGARMNLTVTPRTWSGRGSLGASKEMPICNTNYGKRQQAAGYKSLSHLSARDKIISIRSLSQSDD